MPMHGGHIDIEGGSAKLKLIVNVGENNCGTLTNSVSNTMAALMVIRGPQESMSWSTATLYMDDLANWRNKSAGEIEAFCRSPP